MAFAGFSPETLGFLQGLRDHNDKDWFAANRSTYDDFFMPQAKEFVAAMGARFDGVSPGIHAQPKVNGSIFRIHRDTRFAKDKRPYKDHLDMMFWKGGGRSRDCPGFFFRLTPDTLHLGAGKHGFSKEDQQKYRAAVVDERGAGLEAVLAALDPAYTVGQPTRKRVPRGWPADHPRADLLRHDGLWCGWEAPVPAEVGGPELVDFCLGHFKNQLGLLDWLADVLEV